MAEVGVHTIAEIRSQAEIWRASLARSRPARRAGPVTIIGCGSSYYVALAAAHAINATAQPASEALLYPEVTLPPGGTLVAVSRSGETSEVLAALDVARRRGLRILGVTCAPEGTLARVADDVMAFPEAAEASLVMTRSFTTMLLGLLRWGGAPFDLTVPPDPGPREADRLVYLGAGPRFGLAMEGALKVQEMSLTPAVAYHPLEFRHGPIALVGPGTLVVLLRGEAGRVQETKLADELRKRGAEVLEVEAGLPAATVPLQLLGYHRAIARGIDCDEPATLSRCVKLDLGGNDR